MLRLSIILLFIILLTGCQRDKQQWLKAANGVTLIESSYHWNVEPFAVKSARTTIPVYYLGKRRDTLSLTDHPIPYRQFFSEEPEYNGRFLALDVADLKLFVDTSVVTYYSYSEIVESKYPLKSMFEAENKPEEYKVISHLAYPVFMYNNSESLLFVGDGNVLGGTTIEAVDSIGQWKAAVHRFEYRCGTGLRELVLKPNEMLVSKYPVRKGAVYTRLRLKFMPWRSGEPLYSNEFWGNIDFQKED